MVGVNYGRGGMHVKGAGEGLNLPEWYRIELESRKIIAKLKDVHELTFYSENPDPFIRRLAITRAGALGSREAFSILNNVVDDPLENEHNKTLAGAYMRKINDSLGLGYYIKNRFMREYENGDPTVSSLPIEDSQPAIRYDFSKSLIESQLQLDQSVIKMNLDDRELTFQFPLGQWLKYLGKTFKTNAIQSFKRFCLVSRSFLLYGVKALSVNLHRVI